MKKFKLLVVMLLTASVCFVSSNNDVQASRKYFKAKYVFLFIADGMGSDSLNSAEAYLAAMEEDDTVAGGVKSTLLSMSKDFNVRGMATTYANNRFITGSAAAGTALACGKKTNIGVISMDPDGENPYASIAELAKQQGMKVGIVSSVSIDHATPAVFYAHQPSRSMYHEIGHDLVNSGFDYFGGGGFKRPDGSLGNVLDAAVAKGYEIATTREEMEEAQPGQKLIAYNHTLDSSKALYYDLDRPDDHISLAEFTKKGIELLSNSCKKSSWWGHWGRHNNGCDKGFFMMVEGGKIDWANHANDARAAIDDIIAFDDAIKEALEFYKKHPAETLIVVTSDHECGGVSLGFANMEYETDLQLLDGQTKSYDEFDKIIAEYLAGSPSEDIDGSAMENMILDGFGLVFDDLNEWEQDLLEDAYDFLRNKPGDYSVANYPEESLLYGYYNPLSVTCTHVLNRRAGIAFTSYYHTGVPVPVMAKGFGSQLFGGFYDNTDVARKIAQAMGVYRELKNAND